MRAPIEHELALIAELRYEPFFLTVHDIVRFARSQGILCQGRGSAANSRRVLLPRHHRGRPERGAALLFERFISRERNEPPDIDVDFEHERREEVHPVHLRQVRARARRARGDGHHATGRGARCATSARRSASSSRQVERLAERHAVVGRRAAMAERLREAGFDPDSPRGRSSC